jgi:hypothetical protein
MHRTIKTIRVKPGSELDQLLAEADDAELQFERDGIRYRVNRVDTESDADLWSGYDSEAALAGMRRAAGSWGDVDADALKEELYRAREQGSRSSDRP